jgi:hypothetical protein
VDALESKNDGGNNLAAHEADADPHSQYLTQPEGDALYAPLSHVGDGGAAHAVATDSVAGFMSAADKVKLDGLSAGYVMLTADYVLANVATEQKYFDNTPNGALTLAAGVYAYDWFAYLTGMSATSGNAAFDPVGAGTAVTDRWGGNVVGIDDAAPLSAGSITGSAFVTQQTVASATTATTATAMTAMMSGMFRISTGGTIIPSVTLVTASAASAKAGSWFRIRRVGLSTESYVGAWT